MRSESLATALSRVRSGRWLRATTLAAALLPLAAAAQSDFAQCKRTALVDFPGTIVEAAVATPALSTLTNLVVAAGLADALSQPGHLTVFAPTNEAFGKIPSSVLGALGGDLGVLTAVLTYHVVPGRADPRLPFKREVHTLQGQSLLVGYERRAGPQVNQSTAGCQGVRTSNGTVWIVDSVLLPQFR